MTALSGRLSLILLGLGLIALAAGPASSQTPRGHGAEARDMELVGHDDLQGRSAYQPTIHKQGGRYIAYVGHHGGKARNPLTGAEEDTRTSTVEEAAPARPRRAPPTPARSAAPRSLAHIPRPAGGLADGAAQVARVCYRHGKTYLLRTFGNAVPTSGHEVWDVSDPTRARRASTVVTGLTATHKNFWECDTG